MQLKKNATKEKQTGTYYTSTDVADAIVNRLVGPGHFASILEPSVGGGVFINSLFNSNKEIGHIDAVEIDGQVAKTTMELFASHHNVSVIHNDFFRYYEQLVKTTTRFDLVIGNPPYIRYQYLSNDERIHLSKILRNNGLMPNKLINAWVGFVVACENLLTEDGRMAFVVPAELLQVGYSSDLRSFLSSHFSSVSVFTFKKLLFDNLQQETVILVCSKHSLRRGIRIIESDDIHDLLSKDIDQINYQPFPEVPSSKWTSFFDSEIHRETIPFLPLKSFGIINVGLTTGSNSFFSVSKDVIKNYNLANYCIPLLGKSNQARCCNFVHKDYLKNRNMGRRADLLVLPEKPKTFFSQGVQNYLSYGENIGIQNGYKCSIRDCWWSIPSIWIPDLFFQRRCGANPKLVLNSCGAISTDTMHRIKLDSGINPKLLVLCFYNSITFASAETAGRSYGGGVLEILPSEAGNTLVPDISLVNDIDVDEAFNTVDSLIRGNDSYVPALDYVDELILVKKLGISKATVDSYRKSWVDLSSRRLERGAAKGS